MLSATNVIPFPDVLQKPDTDLESILGEIRQVRLVLQQNIDLLNQVDQRLIAIQNRPQALTQTEVAILQGVAQGLTHRAIARQLGYQESTISQYANRLARKLGAHSRIHAVTIAKDLGLI